jgi:predicted permease
MTKLLSRAGLWIRANLQRGRLEREMREEFSVHLERSAERLMARGLSAEQARRQAVREFGNLAWLQEESRYARGTVWLDALFADARFALRQFARTPGTTMAMFVVLSFGMAISTLLFSYSHSYSTRPPKAIERSEDLVRIRGSRRDGVDGRASRSFSQDELFGYQQLTDHFAAVAGWSDAFLPLVAGDEVEGRSQNARVTFVTDDFFSVLGVQPVVGGGLPMQGSGDGSASARAVIGYDAWAQLFGRRAQAIGSTLSVSGVTVTIVGVAPPGFSGVGGYNRLHLWMLVSARPLLMPEPLGEFRAVARLQPGVSLRAATTAAQVVATHAGQAAELSEQDPSVDVVTLLASNGEPMFERDVRLMLLSLGLVGLLILAVTITNVSALLVGLAAARRQEIAARLSLGAARLRVIRQLLTESALLASIAAGAALFVDWVVLRLAARFVPELTLQLEITWQAALFALGTALVAGVVFGLSPALHATRLAIATTLRDASGTIVATRARLQRGLVVAQIALTQPLIVLLAALLIVVLGEFRPTRTDGDRLIGVSLSFLRPPSRSGHGDWQVQMRESMRRLNERLKATPGIAAVAMIDAGERTLGSYTVHPEDQAAAAMETAVPLSGVATAEGYFAVNGLDIIRGRDFLPGEVWPVGSRAGETPVIIDTDLARRLWADDPLGHRLRATNDTASLGTLAIVGVVDTPPDRRRAGGHRIYLPPDTSIPFGFPMVRTIASAQPLLPLVRRIIDQETPAGVTTNVNTFAEIEKIQRRELRVALGGVSTAGLLALIVSAIGLYAVVAFSVTQRTGEIAVRIAIGGRIPQIVRKFIGDGLRLSLFGLVFGLPASLLGFRILITNVDIADVPLAPVTAIAAVGLLLVALAAVWIPARRAASVHPAAILRRE